MSMEMERVLEPRLWMNVTPQWGVIMTMITSLLVITTLWMPQKQFGKPWECLKVSGVDWIYTGLMLKIDFQVSKSCLFVLE